MTNLLTLIKQEHEEANLNPRLSFAVYCIIQTKQEYSESFQEKYNPINISITRS